MCSIVLIHHVLEDFPILIGANRDENKDRPASGPEISHQGDRTVLAPKDLEAGGTWLGTNDAGLFAGITNRFAAPRHTDRRSRGELPLLALAQENPRQAVEVIQEQGPSAFNAFHLLLAQADDARIIWSDGEQFHEKSLKPGIHILTESSFEAGPPDRGEFIQNYLSPMINRGQITVAEIQKLLGEKREPSFHGLCVDVPEINYATRSATVYQEKSDGSREFHYSSVPPDQHQWSNLSHLIP
jgi:uncharacterized protein with NRDE domain